MGAKGTASRNRIMKAAQGLFTVRGFQSVTMQDICVETGLSRGGLYRYFSSTEEILLAIVAQEQQQAKAFLQKALEEKIPPNTMLLTFLRLRTETLLQNGAGFENAVSEFAAASPRGKKVQADRAESSIEILSSMIEAGCRTGDFCCENPRAVAIHILWVFEGMSQHNTILPISRQEADGQLRLLKTLLHQD